MNHDKRHAVDSRKGPIRIKCVILSGVVKDLRFEDKDKDLWFEDKDNDLRLEDKDKDLWSEDKDKDLRSVSIS